MFSFIPTMKVLWGKAELRVEFALLSLGLAAVWLPRNPGGSPGEFGIGCPVLVEVVCPLEEQLLAKSCSWATFPTGIFQVSCTICPMAGFAWKAS